MNPSHAIVVGGTRGLGRGLVELWAEGTDPISVIGRNVTPSVVPKHQGNVRHYAADITVADSILPALQRMIQLSGPVSRLVFSQRFRGTGDTLDAELEVGIKGTQRIIEHLVSTGQFAAHASIVVVSSVCSELITPEQPLGYHLTKSALDQLVRFYAVRLARQGIRVNGVAPNLIEKEEGRAFYLQNPELKKHYETIIPLGQMGTPRDVANAIDFLCSDRAAYITGQILTIDGGLTLQLQHSLTAPPVIPLKQEVR